MSIPDYMLTDVPERLWNDESFLAHEREMVRQIERRKIIFNLWWSGFPNNRLRKFLSGGQKELDQIISYRCSELRPHEATPEMSKQEWLELCWIKSQIEALAQWSDNE